MRYLSQEEYPEYASDWAVVEFRVAFDLGTNLISDRILILCS